MIKEFDKPLDTKIDEIVEVEKNVLAYDPKSNKVYSKKVTEKVSVPTVYTKATTETLLCPKNKHYFVMKDRNSYEAECINCSLVMFLNPIKDTIIDGKIIPVD